MKLETARSDPKTETDIIQNERLLYEKIINFIELSKIGATPLEERIIFIAKTLLDLTEYRVAISSLIVILAFYTNYLEDTENKDADDYLYIEIENIFNESKVLREDVEQILNKLEVQIKEEKNIDGNLWDEIEKILKDLKVLYDYTSHFRLNFQNDSQIEKFIKMIFVFVINKEKEKEKENGIRVLFIELVHRLAIIKKIPNNFKVRYKDFVVETFKIFVPIANRLGLWKIKWQLEDFSFKEMEPETYLKIASLLAEKRSQRENYMLDCREQINSKISQDEHLKDEKIEVLGRSKSIYSTYSKMKQFYCYDNSIENSKLSFDKFNSIIKKIRAEEFNNLFAAVHDLFGIRVLCESKLACYKVLAIIQDSFPQLATHRRKQGELMADYISRPKPNGYQSLHVVVCGPQQRALEIQIRTYEMHTQAEYGLAAHWKYKEIGQSQHTNKKEHIFTEIKKIIERQNIADEKDTLEEYEIYEIYVFTPRGEIVPLPKNSTPIDFAYQIHTQVGNHCAGVRINGQWTVLGTPLKNGDIVEIITQKNSHPSLDWLNFAVTPSARNRIRQWYKRSHRDENVARGRELLEKELGKRGFEALLKSEPMHIVAEQCNYHSVEDLLAGLGYGEVTLNLVVNRWREAEKAQQPIETDTQETPISQAFLAKLPTMGGGKGKPIAGVKGLLHHVARCCNPVPGQPIIGVVTRTHGISIHRQGCVNVKKMPGERVIPVSWNPTDGHLTSANAVHIPS